MINASELRLGNYTYVDVANEKLVCKIMAITILDEGATGFRGNLISGFTSNKDLEPIPLTKELFNKILGISNPRIGFEFAENFTCYWCDDENGIVIEEYSEGEFPLSHIKHVHQLQNLYYALTGKEFEINLD